jgi:hypothetical protein
MNCTTLFLPPMAMATTQLARVSHHEDASSWMVAPKTDHSSLRMSWVVVTGEHGHRQLCMHWVTGENDL